jgi:hypothetical protein
MSATLSPTPTLDDDGDKSRDDVLINYRMLKFSAKCAQAQVERWLKQDRSEVQKEIDSLKAELGDAIRIIGRQSEQLDQIRDDLRQYRLEQADRRADDLVKLQESAERAARNAATDAVSSATVETTLPVASEWSAGSHKQGAIVRHRSGLWQARCSTTATPGSSTDWQCVAAGIFVAELNDVDERNHELVLALSDGTRQTLPIHTPALVDRGVFREGGEYVKGDAVSHGGSLWIAQEDAPSGIPGTAGSGFRLAVKHGKNGSDGKPAASAPVPSMRFYDGHRGYHLVGDLVADGSEIWLCILNGNAALPNAALGQVRSAQWRLLNG